MCCSGKVATMPIVFCIKKVTFKDPFFQFTDWHLIFNSKPFQSPPLPDFFFFVISHTGNNSIKIVLKSLNYHKQGFTARRYVQM